MRGKRKYKLKKYNMGTQYVDTPNYSSVYNMKGQMDGKSDAVDGFRTLGSSAANTATGDLTKAAGKGAAEGGVVAAGSMALGLGGTAMDARNEKVLGENMAIGKMQDKGSMIRGEALAEGMKFASTGASVGGAVGTAILPGAGTLIGAGIGAGTGFIGGGIYGGIKGKDKHYKLSGTMKNINQKFDDDRLANQYTVDPFSMQRGDTGVNNKLYQAKNGLVVGKYKYKNGTKGVKSKYSTKNC